MQIKMVDLHGQYIKIKDEVDAAMQAVIDNSAFIKGPQVKEFEDALAQYLYVKHVIGCGNGTDALQIAMMALDLKSGDEIIIPSFTYVATAEVIALLGLIPVMVDVDKNTFCIDPKLIEAKITPKTKAIVPVHLFGQCANMDAIMQIAVKHNLFVIEDNAQALGATYTFENGKTQYAGTIGHIGTTSFFPSKNLGCYGDGGAIFTNDAILAKKIRMICNHGQKVQYVHDIVGVNSRIDTLQAAILLVKLKHLPTYQSSRIFVAELYDKLLGNHPNIIIPYRIHSSSHVFHQYTIQLVGLNRDWVREKLKEVGIPSMVYYPLPLHLQKAYQFYAKGENFPVAEELSKTVLSLPMHTELKAEEIQQIANQLLSLNKLKSIL